MATSTITATDLLRQQHENVKAMFAQAIAAQGREREEVFDCLRATLAVHETAEEMTVQPAARQLGPEGQAIAQARLEEEREAKALLAELEKLGTEADGFGVKLVELQRAVLQHADAEEHQMFPLLEQAAGRAHLVEMADAIRTAEDLAPTHPHPHAPDSPLGNLLVGPFAKMVDAVRDRINR